MNFYVVIVIFNKECAHSITCNTLPFAENVAVLVMDNSTLPIDNARYCAGRQWKHISMGGNRGLSGAYNRALDELAGLYGQAGMEGQAGLDGHLVWLDDDTEICSDYFDRLSKHILDRPDADIFLPVVMNGDRILSPSRMGRLLSREVKRLSMLTPANITAVNSGMAVNCRVYGRYRYDARLFLDCVDHQFIKDMKKEGRAMHVMRDVTLRQQFFGSQRNAPWADVMRRYALFSRDFLTFAGKTPAGAAYARLYLLYRYCKLLIKRLCRL